VEALGGDWTLTKTQLDLNDLKKAIDPALSKITGNIVPDAALKEIREAARKASAWGLAKKIGEECLPAGDIRKRYRRLIEALNRYGLYVVPKGEMDSSTRKLATTAHLGWRKFAACLGAFLSCTRRMLIPSG
jgi:hypothetical protein